MTTSTVAEEGGLDFGAADTTAARKTMTTTTKVNSNKSGNGNKVGDDYHDHKTAATDWYGKDEGYLPVIPW